MDSSIESKLLEFMTQQARESGEIKGLVVRNTQLFDEMRKTCSTCISETAKIPGIEKKIEDHETHHKELKKVFYYPVAVSVVGMIAAMILKWIARVF